MHSRKLTRARIAAAATGALLPVLAAAHHGWSWYGEDDFMLSATVVETHFGNPHDRLVVEADGERWNMLLSPPQRSRRAGFDESAVSVGDRVTAYGRRHRDAATLEMKTERIEVSGERYDLYPNRL